MGEERLKEIEPKFMIRSVPGWPWLPLQTLYHFFPMASSTSNIWAEWATVWKGRDSIQIEVIIANINSVPITQPYYVN